MTSSVCSGKLGQSRYIYIYIYLNGQAVMAKRPEHSCTYEGPLALRASSGDRHTRAPSNIDPRREKETTSLNNTWRSAERKRGSSAFKRKESMTTTGAHAPHATLTMGEQTNEAHGGRIQKWRSSERARNYASGMTLKR